MARKSWLAIRVSCLVPCRRSPVERKPPRLCARRSPETSRRLSLSASWLRGSLHLDPLLPPTHCGIGSSQLAGFERGSLAPPEAACLDWFPLSHVSTLSI